MKIWDSLKAKLYNEIMNWNAAFFGLSEDATEAEIHAEMEKTTGTLEQIREEAMKAATEAVSQQLEDFKAQLATNTQAIADMKEAVAAKETEVSELTEKVTTLEASSAEKDKKITEISTAHETEKKTLQQEISKLKAGKPKEGDNETDTVSGELGNGGGNQAGAVIKNTSLRNFLKKGEASNN